MTATLTTVVCTLLAAPAAAEAPVFVARTTAGKEVTGPLVRLDGWAAEVGKGLRHRLRAGDLLSLRREGSALPAFPTDEHLVLANGDRVPAQSLRLDDEKLSFRHKDLGGGKEVSLPLSAVTLLWRLPPDGTASPARLRRRLLAGKRAKDLVLLRNGDTIEGTLHAIKGGKLAVEVNKKTVAAPWPQVAAVAMSTELADRLRPRGLHARVVLSAGDGSPGGRLTLVSASADAETLEGKTVFGAELRVPLERVVALQMRGEKVVPLSELEPAKYVFFPYLDEKWPWRRDASATDRDLRVAGSTYDQGVGMHAPSRLTYQLGGAYRRFEAVVGLDNQDGKKGRVRLRVLIDGKPAELTKKDVWTHIDGALRVSVDVTGARELALEVRCADHGPVQAVVDWADAVLLK
jgi:hypothetical protein